MKKFVKIWRNIWLLQKISIYLQRKTKGYNSSKKYITLLGVSRGELLAWWLIDVDKSAILVRIGVISVTSEMQILHPQLFGHFERRTAILADVDKSATFVSVVLLR